MSKYIPPPEFSATLGDFKAEAVKFEEHDPPFVVLRIYTGNAKVTVFCEKADQVVALGEAIRDAGIGLLLSAQKAPGTFRKGDRVVCLRGSNYLCAENLTEGETYTVDSINGKHVSLVERAGIQWAANRFRLATPVA